MIILPLKVKLSMDPPDHATVHKQVRKRLTHLRSHECDSLFNFSLYMAINCSSSVIKTRTNIIGFFPMFNSQTTPERAHVNSKASS